MGQKKGGIPKKRLIWLCIYLFIYGVILFKPNFLSPPLSKMKNFSAHQKEEDLRITKITLLLFLVPYLGEFGLSNMGTFFLGHPVYIKEFSSARTNLYSEPFQHNNWQYIIVLKFITVKYWTQIGPRLNLAFAELYSNPDNSICTTSSMIIIMLASIF